MAYVRLFTSSSSVCTNTITTYVKDRTGAAQPRPISTDISCREGGSATRNGCSVLPWVDNQLRRKFHDRFHGWNHASSSPAIHEFSWIKNRSYCNLRWKFCYVDYIKLLNSIFFPMDYYESLQAVHRLRSVSREIASSASPVALC